MPAKSWAEACQEIASAFAVIDRYFGHARLLFEHVDTIETHSTWRIKFSDFDGSSLTTDLTFCRVEVMAHRAPVRLQVAAVVERQMRKLLPLVWKYLINKNKFQG